MAPFLWFVLQVDERVIKGSAFPWYLKLGSKKFVFFFFALVLD
jgi:hypothetical protein